MTISIEEKFESHGKDCPETTQYVGSCILSEGALGETSSLIRSALEKLEDCQELTDEEKTALRSTMKELDPTTGLKVARYALGRGEITLVLENNNGFQMHDGGFTGLHLNDLNEISSKTWLGQDSCLAVASNPTGKKTTGFIIGS